MNEQPTNYFFIDIQNLVSDVIYQIFEFVNLKQTKNTIK